jgi:mono/diheme cytochrome c family protein
MIGAALVLATTLVAGVPAANAQGAADALQAERGRYIAVIGGCNDCHTVGYPERGGQVPDSDWLTGLGVGFNGPWGTTYPANLRLLAASISEDEWVARARRPTRPPMPWFNLAAMSEPDLRALYQFVRSLGAKGEPAPAYAAPGDLVKTPVIVFVPQTLPQRRAQSSH